MKLGMLCPRRKRSDTPVDLGPIIDIQKLIQDYVWREFTRDMCCLPGIFVRRNDFIIEVPWSFLEIHHRTMKFVPRTKTSGGVQDKKQVVLFSTKFQNNTHKEQSYKLKTQRHTKATTTVTCQRGYIADGTTNLNLKLQLPEKYSNCGVSAGLSGQLTVANSTGETIEEMYIWEADSDVVVESNYQTEAKMLLTEDELVADFEVKSLLRLPSGEAPVTIRRRKDLEIQGVLMLTDLSDVFADCNVRVIEMPDENKKIRINIEFTTVGILQSIRWRDQRICLESNPIGQDSAGLEPDLMIDSKEICTQILRHATRTVETVVGPPSEELAQKRTETKDMRFPTIPTIITEMHEETPSGSGSKEKLPLAKSQLSSQTAVRRQSVSVAPKTEGQASPSESKSTLKITTGSPPKLAKVTSV